MRARYAYVQAILKIHTFDAVEIAHDHFLDFIHLCSDDAMGARNWVPALLLRLGKDQHCYEFIKCWQVHYGDYNWDDPLLSDLDLDYADVLEPVEYLCRDFVDLSHAVTATLVKIRLLLGIEQALQSSATLRECSLLPTELSNKIQDSLLSGVVGESWDKLDATQRSHLVDTLSSQIAKLYSAVKKRSPHFWSALLNPGSHLEARLDPSSKGAVEEMQLILQCSVQAWMETPGAFDVIREKCG